MNTVSQNLFRIQSRPPADSGSFPGPLRLSGHFLSVASDIGALEECLALERSLPAHASTSQAEGIFSPPAVPYCDFLMLRNAAGQLLAVSRLMRLHRENPVRSPLESGHFQLSPLLTALRYSREGVVEMGSPAFLPGCDTAKVARLLWQGLLIYLERNGVGFVVGWDVLLIPSASASAAALPRLMDAHGLHPDLEVEALSRFRRQGPAAQPDRFQGERFHAEGAAEADKLPAGLHEALRRGCRLAAEPVLNETTGRWEFVWVSFRDMLVSDNLNSGDWSR